MITAAFSLAAYFFVPETYESVAVLVYEGSPLPVQQNQSSPLMSAFVRSAAVPSRLREVRERLGWEISDEEIKSRVVVTEEKDGGSMTITAEAPNAEDAQRLAQTMLEVFLEQQAVFNSKKLDLLKIENEASLERATERLDAAQAAFDVFREKSGKPNLLDEKAQLIKRAAELRVKVEEAGIEVAAQSALIRELEEAQRELPRQVVASSTKGSAVDAPLAKARSELAEARASLSEEHPRVQALQQRVARLLAQKGDNPVEVGGQTLMLNPARASVDEQLAGARAAVAAAQERQAALQVLLENVKREAQALAPDEGEARLIMGEMAAALARVDELKVQRAAIRDASLRSLTGFRVLSVPVVPEESSRVASYVGILGALPILVVLLAAIVILARALKTLQLEAPREVAWWGNGPVLGTSVWPRDPNALDAFVDELEDQGMYGAGRTLVVPATEAEREVACSFAMRLADAPWLAAAILDVGDRADSQSPLVTPAPSGGSPWSPATPRRLSTQGTPSVAHGRAVPRKPTLQGFIQPSEGPRSSPPNVVITPPPNHGPHESSSSRPPRKRTVIGLPAVQSSKPIEIQEEAVAESAPPASTSTASDRPRTGPQPFRRKRSARATVRMVVPVTQDAAAPQASTARDSTTGEEAFLLTRPVAVTNDETPSEVGRETPESAGNPNADSSNAVMRAAVRLLGHADEDITRPRPSAPPVEPRFGDVSGVALAWNGPLSGPVLRRAARLAHRVIVVVSAGLSAVDLTRIRTRLGRDGGGVGYVLVNVDDAYVAAEDRVGPVEEFWRGEREADA